MILVATLATFATSLANAQFTVQPAKVSFANTRVGMSSSSMIITVTNTGSANLIIDSYTVSPSEFQLVEGWSPVTLVPTGQILFGIKFVPDVAQTFTGQLTLNIEGSAPVVVPLTGSSLVSKAVASVTPTSLAFSQPIGTTSPPQTVTIKNVGTAAMKVTAVAYDPPFQVTNFVANTLISPGVSLPLNLIFSAAASGSSTSTNALVISFDVVPPKGVDLSGTATPAQSLVVSAFPILPAAVSSNSYLANLTAAGGTPPYSWALSGASTLPSGLTLSSAGSITGTVTSTVAAGNYPFQVQLTDSTSPVPVTVTTQLTFPVMAPSGAKCSNITRYLPKTSIPVVAVNDLGTGTYLGSEGGLYPNGSNVRPASHDAAGVAIAQGIQPLDANGSPDLINGKMGLISIGMSATFNTWNTFVPDANAEPSRNPHVVFVEGAQPLGSAVDFANPSSPFWNPIFQNFLPNAGLTANQVVAAWIMNVDPRPTGTFPTDMAALQGEYESIAQNLHTKFPNLKLAYFTSKFYDAYSNGVSGSNPEPYAYESGFAVKWAIQDQINGNANLNYDPANGPVMAPWMAWGPYDWTNGLLGRSDGLVWSCHDVTFDGVHPSKTGSEAESNFLLNFLKSDTTATPWFLAH